MDTLFWVLQLSDGTKCTSLLLKASRLPWYKVDMLLVQMYIIRIHFAVLVRFLDASKTALCER